MPATGQQFAQFGAGCFWSVELAFQRVSGVTKTEVVEIKVKMDCDGCERRVWNSVSNMKGVRNAAQRKLLDEFGIPAKDKPVDQFTPLGRMLYKAPSDGKWGEHECDKSMIKRRYVYLTGDLKREPQCLCLYGTFFGCNARLGGDRGTKTRKRCCNQGYKRMGPAKVQDFRGVAGY